MEFSGYGRADGSVGVRNHVLVLPAGNCANELSVNIAGDIDGALALTHDHECSRGPKDRDRAKATLVGIGRNPNVASVLVVGLGCDPIPADEIAEGVSLSGKPVEVITIEKSGGFEQALTEGHRVCRKLTAIASQMTRKPFDIGRISIGVKCTGTHPMSPLAGHQAVARSFDTIITAGGIAMFSETAELIGAEHIVAKKAVDPGVAKRLYDVVERMEKDITAMGVDIRGTQPNRANIQSGITTLEEKSLSGIVKSGTTPLRGVLEYAEKPQASGLYFMDGTAQTCQLFAGMAAAGVQIQLLSVGGGTPARFRNLPGFAGWPPVVPVIKILSNPGNCDEAEFFDIYAGNIVEGKETANQVGARLMDEIISVASGKPTKSETLSRYQEPLAMYTTGILL